MHRLAKHDWRDVDAYVEAFERARGGGARGTLDDHLPDVSHPRFAEILLELVRVDLEMGWQQGRPASIESYLERFGRWLATPDALAQIAFEEYRCRRTAGETVSADEYTSRFAISTDHWPAAPASETNESSIAREQADGAGDVKFPAAGTKYLGFDLLEELGRGAFSRVYLARQGELANRHVVLKVSTSRVEESDKLAQLQHAHIVPIYSVHRDGPLTAVVMPFFGACTLADVLRQVEHAGALPASGMALLNTHAIRADSTWRTNDCAPRAAQQATAPVSLTTHSAPDLRMIARFDYQRAVLWITARLAQGLEHAHARGIVHRDLKPANVLLAHDGRPMLLDFNLSEDVKLPSADSSAIVGGTLPYMAPEQVRAYLSRSSSVDPRSDLFSLGVIVYELLVGRAPFPVRTGPINERIAYSLADRQRAPKRVRDLVPRVSRATSAIVERLLAPEADARYQSAAELVDDLQRQLSDRPLRHAPDRSVVERSQKWARRHPRVSSATSAAILCGLLLSILGISYSARGRQLAQIRAEQTAAAFQTDLLAARVAGLQAASEGGPALARAETNCRAALARFGALDGDTWRFQAPFTRLPVETQTRVRQDIEQVRSILAACAVDRSGLPSTTKPSASPPATLARAPADDLARAACALSLERRFREALPIWQRAADADPRQIWTWFGLGSTQLRLGQFEPAIASLTACSALAPEFAEAYALRGAAHLKLAEYGAALADLDRAAALDPTRDDVPINRALALLSTGNARYAAEVLSGAIEKHRDHARLYLLRSRAREQFGDAEGAAADRNAVIAGDPRDEHGWNARGIQLVERDPEQALAAFVEASRANPLDRASYENRAYVLAERLGKNADAIAVLGEALARFPDDAVLHATRGVLEARMGALDDARADGRRALALGESPEVCYRVAGIYANTASDAADDRKRAFDLLAFALRAGFGEELLDFDRDLDPLREDLQFRGLVDAVRFLRAMRGDAGASVAFDREPTAKVSGATRSPAQQATTLAHE